MVNVARSSNCAVSLYSMRIISGVRTVKRAPPHVTTAAGLARGLGAVLCAPAWAADTAKSTAVTIRKESDTVLFIRIYFSKRYNTYGISSTGCSLQLQHRLGSNGSFCYGIRLGVGTEVCILGISVYCGFILLARVEEVESED